MTFFLVVHEISLIDTTIVIGENSFAMHLVIKPVAYIGTSVRPRISTIALNFIFLKLAIID